MPASSPPLISRKSPLLSTNRNICMVGDEPSGGVNMFALSMWLLSGPPLPLVPAPSSACASTRSVFSKLPLAALKPIGAARRWSWNWLTKANTWVVFCARLVCQEVGVSESHEHWWLESQPPSVLEAVKSVNGKRKLVPLDGVTSSVALPQSSSSTSEQACTKGPVRFEADAGSQPF